MSAKILRSAWDDIKNQLKKMAWAALLAFLKWLVERWASNPGSSSRDADSEK